MRGVLPGRLRRRAGGRRWPIGVDEILCCYLGYNIVTRCIGRASERHGKSGGGTAGFRCARGTAIPRGEAPQAGIEPIRGRPSTRRSSAIRESVGATTGEGWSRRLEGGTRRPQEI